MRMRHFGLLATAVVGLCGGRGAAQMPKPTELPVVAPPSAAVPAPPAVMPAQPGAYGALQDITGCPPPAAETPPPPPPYGGPFHDRAKMLGDWCGIRSQLREHGLTFDIYSTNFYTGVANGGLQETFKYRGRADYLLHVDGEKAGLWKGSFIDLHGESVFGDSINKYTGSLLPVSLAQVLPAGSQSVTALTGVKFTQALSESFIVFGGKINTLDNFNQPFTGGARGVDGFLNTGFLFNPVFARTIPYSTFGGGFAYLVDLQPVVSFSVFDANNTPTTTGFPSFFNNGAVYVPQINIPTNFFGLPGHQGITATFSTKRYSEIDRSTFTNPIVFGVAPQTKSNSWSMAYNFDQTIYAAPDDPKRSWGAFGNLGLADQNPSPFRWFANIGVGGSSPLPCRKLDSFGIGYYYLGVNTSLKNLAPQRLPIRDEQAIEAFYNVGVTPWFHVTPDLQVVLPGQTRASSALILGLRAKIDF